jgi:hypothetical protein
MWRLGDKLHDRRAADFNNGQGASFVSFVDRSEPGRRDLKKSGRALSRVAIARYWPASLTMKYSCQPGLPSNPGIWAIIFHGSFIIARICPVPATPQALFRAALAVCRPVSRSSCQTCPQRLNREPNRRDRHSPKTALPAGLLLVWIMAGVGAFRFTFGDQCRSAHRQVADEYTAHRF